MIELDPYKICAQYREQGFPFHIRWVGDNEHGEYFFYYGYQPAIATCKTNDELLKIMRVAAKVQQKIVG